MKVEIYGAPYCSFCKQAVKACEASDIDYQYYDIQEEPSRKSEMNIRIGKEVKTIPQIFVNGDHVGGFTDFRELLG